MSTNSINFRDMVTGATPSFSPATRPLPATGTTSGVRLETVTVAEWDNTLTRFGDGVPEQTGIFNAARWGLPNIECVKLFRHRELIGGAVLIVRKIPFSPVGLAILKGGPVWRRAGFQADFGLYEAAIEVLVEEYCHSRNLHLTIMPPAFPQFSKAMCASLESLAFSRGNTLAAPERYIVNTGQSPDDLMASLGQKWRYNLRKALKNDFRIGFADNAGGLETFLELYGKMMARKRFLDASAISALAAIVRTADLQVKPRIVLVSHQGEVTAGGIFSMFGDMAGYMFGATDNRALRLKAGYALHWWVAEYLCNLASAKWYDLGGNDSDAGLHQFKKRFCRQVRTNHAGPAAIPFCRIIPGCICRWSDLQFTRCPSRCLKRRPQRETKMRVMSKAGLSRYLPRFSVLVAGRLAGAFAIFLVNILIARHLGIEALGSFAVFAALVAVATICLPVGYNSVAAIFSAEYSASGNSAFLKGYIYSALKHIGLTATALIFSIAALFYLIPNFHSADNFVLAAAVVLTAIATSVLNLNGAIMTGGKRQVAGLLPETLLRPVLLLIGVYAVLATRPQSDISNIMAVVAVASWATLLIFFVRKQSLTGLLQGPPAEFESPRWKNAAYPWLATSLLWDYSVDLVLVLASLLFGAVEIAILHICFRYRVLAGFGVRTIHALAMPEISESKINDNRVEMERRISLTNFASLGYAVLVLMLFSVFGGWLLALFSSDIAQNTPALLVISLTMIIRAALGPAPLVLAIHNQHTVTTAISAIGLIIAAAIVLALYQPLGVMAVAIGYTASNLVVSLSLWRYAKRKTGIDCSIFTQKGALGAKMAT